MSFTAVPAAGARLTAGRLAALATELRPIVAKKTSDETVNNSATLQDDEALFVSVAANTIYRLHLDVSYNSGTTPDIKFGWVYPTGTTINWTTLGYDTSGVFQSFTLVETDVTAAGGIAAARGFQAFGTVTVGSTAGTLILQWAQNTANASDTKVLIGSSLELRQAV